MKLHLKPAHVGALIPDPDRGNQYLPPEGYEVERSPYWLHRINQGDVVEAHVEPLPVPDTEVPAAPAAARAPAADPAPAGDDLPKSKPAK
jgi:uncharacterized protein DUF2635